MLATTAQAASSMGSSFSSRGDSPTERSFNAADPSLWNFAKASSNACRRTSTSSADGRRAVKSRKASPIRSTGVEPASFPAH